MEATGAVGKNLGSDDVGGEMSVNRTLSWLSRLARAAKVYLVGGQ